MDLQVAIRQLKIQKLNIDLVIAELEQLQLTAGGNVVMPNRRGRRSMSSEERQRVSERMRLYWANRKRQEHLSICAEATVS